MNEPVLPPLPSDYELSVFWNLMGVWNQAPKFGQTSHIAANDVEKELHDQMRAYALTAIAADRAQRVPLTDEIVRTFVDQYNAVYCDQRKAGVGGGNAERAAMWEVLKLALPTCRVPQGIEAAHGIGAKP